MDSCLHLYYLHFFLLSLFLFVRSLAFSWCATWSSSLERRKGETVETTARDPSHICNERTYRARPRFDSRMLSLGITSVPITTHSSPPISKSHTSPHFPPRMACLGDLPFPSEARIFYLVLCFSFVPALARIAMFTFFRALPCVCELSHVV